MYCPNCGNQVSESSRFCQNCGCSLPSNKQSPNKSPSKKKHSFLWWIFIGWYWMPIKLCFKILLFPLSLFKKKKSAPKTVTITSTASHSPLFNKYDTIRKRDSIKNVSYEKQSKLVSIFTKKWYQACLKDFVVLDFETTGLDKVYDNIIEIAAIRYVNGIEADKYITLVKPDVGISNEAESINKITTKMLHSAPSQSEAIPKLIDFLGDSIIVGHNVNFDIGFLEIAAQRLGFNVKYNYIDTMSISKKLFPSLSNYKLGTIAHSIGFDTSNLHRAESDVRVCAEIMKIAVDTLSDNFEETSKALKAVKSAKPQNNTIKSTHDEDLQNMLIREGEFRKSLGETLVIVSNHNGSCERCKCFERKVLIDDVYSGGKKSDGDYMLLSTAMRLGLFHSGCRHSLGTYYPELKDINGYEIEDNKLNNYGKYNKYKNSTAKSVDQEDLL